MLHSFDAYFLLPLGGEKFCGLLVKCQSKGILIHMDDIYILYIFIDIHGCNAGLLDPRIF